MTLPANYPIDWNRICSEFSLNPSTAVWPRDFYGKGGAPASGALSFGNFLGRSGGAAFQPMGGTYSNEGSPGEITITASASVIWTVTKTSGGIGGVVTDQNGAIFTSGNAATSLTFDCSGTATATRTSTWSVSAGGQNWTITCIGDQANCVAVDSPILMADGTEKPAGALIVGDMVATYHEDTLEWGAFRVSAVEFARDLVFAVPGHPTATYRHRFALPRSIARLLPGRARWWRAGWIGKPAGHAMVAKVTVEGAHTYLARNPAPGSKWRLSHNIKQPSQ